MRGFVGLHHRENDDISILLSATKRKIAVYASSIISFLTALILVIWLFEFQKVDWATGTVALVVLYFGAVAFYLRLNGDLGRGIMLLHAGYFVLAPLRIAQTGGLASLGILAVYVFHVLLAFTLNGRKFGYFVFLWNAFSITLFAFLGNILVFPPSPLGGGAIGLVIATVLGMMLISMPVFFILEEKDHLSAQLRELEKQRAAYIIMRRLAHEFGNSIHIALNYTEFLKTEEERKLEYVETVSKRLIEMDQIIKKFIKAADEGDLVDYLKDAREEVKILNKMAKNNKS